MKSSSETPVIYFHVGLGKVASKYLQHLIFPNFRGLHYVPTTQYYRVDKYIKLHPNPVYLVSREFDQQMESEVKSFSQRYHQVHAIILLRRHASWIASQYRRFAKNGFAQPFDQFLDLHNNQGRFRRQDLDFYQKIMILEQTFGHKPLVMFHEDLIANPVLFVQQIARFCQAKIDETKISSTAKHTSYSEKQIKVMQAVSRYIPFGTMVYSRNKLVRFFQRLPEYSLRYIVLYLALLIPNVWINNDPLIPVETLKTIDDLTVEDWQRCKTYAKINNPT